MLNRIFAKATPKARVSRHRKAISALELLEGRALMSTQNFFGPGTFSFTDVSGNHNKIVIADPGFGGITVVNYTKSAGVTTLNGITLAASDPFETITYSSDGAGGPGQTLGMGYVNDQSPSPYGGLFTTGPVNWQLQSYKDFLGSGLAPGGSINVGSILPLPTAIFSTPTVITPLGAGQSLNVAGDALGNIYIESGANASNLGGNVNVGGDLLFLEVTGNMTSTAHITTSANIGTGAEIVILKNMNGGTISSGDFLDLFITGNVGAGATITAGGNFGAFTSVGGNFNGTEVVGGSDTLLVGGNMGGTHVQTGSFQSEVEVFGDLSGSILAPAQGGNQIVYILGSVTPSGYIQAANLGLSSGGLGQGFYVGGDMAGTVIATTSFGPNTPFFGLYTVVGGDLTGTMIVPDPFGTNSSTFVFGGLDGNLTFTGPELATNLSFGEIGDNGNATLNITGTVGDTGNLVTIAILGDFGAFYNASINTGSNFVPTAGPGTQVGKWVDGSGKKTGVLKVVGGNFGTVNP